MSEQELDLLTMAPLDHPLDRLEADVWRGVRRAEATRKVRMAGAYQIVMLTIALIIGVSTGASLAYSGDQTEHESALMPGARLAPSTLLLGRAE